MARNFLYEREVKVLGAAVAAIRDGRVRAAVRADVGRAIERYAPKSLRAEEADMFGRRPFDWSKWDALCAPGL